MKLKDMPLESWKGKKFTSWCRADKNDERKIVYTFRIADKTHHFTSDDRVSFPMMEDIRSARIESIELKDNVWHVSLIA